MKRAAILSAYSLMFALIFSLDRLNASRPQFAVTLLDAPHNESAWAGSINEAGQCVGQSSFLETLTSHAVLWNGASMTDLDEGIGLPSDWEPNGIYPYSFATGINDAGQVVGYTSSLPGRPDGATLWSGATVTHLGDGYPRAINSAGQIVGSGYIQNGGSFAALWNGTTLTNLGTLGGVASSAFDINDSGKIVGEYVTVTNNNPVYHPVLWSGATASELSTFGLGGSATGINSSGRVVGWCKTMDGHRHATLWNNATPVDLGTLGGNYSEAYSINASGQIVGSSDGGPFLYTSGTMYNLKSLLIPGAGFSVRELYIFQQSSAINDRGQIVGLAEIRISDGSIELRAVRLDPIRLVVFIPGIAGSTLIGNGETGANGNGEYLWPTIGAQDIRAMNLHSGVTDVQAVGIVREYDPGLGGIGTKRVYQPLMDYLVNRLGYREFDLEEHPERMTNSYLQQQTWPQKPTLFTFPYDWRQANSSHAASLHDYIEQISQLHGGAKVDVIAHSMGGLVLRQYLQTYGSGKVNKVVTIGTPVWGSPKAVYRVLTGKFYDNIVDWDAGTDMKAALRSMPSTAELIPPFQVGHISGRTTLLSEDHWNLNNEGSASEIYTPPVFWKYINSIAPGFQTINTTLHSALQDNWHEDNSDISYLQVYGQVTESGKQTTTSDVVAFEKNYSVLGATIFQVHGYRENKGPGDNVVPLESANRPSQYLAPNTEIYKFPPDPIANSDTNDADTNPAEHTELTKNATVHAKIASFLGLTPTPDPAPAAPAPAAPAPAAPAPAAPAPAAPPSSGTRRSVTLFGTGYVPITDSAGNQNTRLTDAAIKKIPGLNIRYHADEGWIEIEGDASKEFTITNPAMTGELETQIVTYNAAGTPDSLTRYRFAPSAQAWRLSAPSDASQLAPSVTSQLAVDTNQNGIFEAGEAVTPSHHVTGAVDMTPPSITMTLSLQAGALSVTMTGSDNVGNPVIRYTINGGALQVYSAPLAFTLDSQSDLKAFAEDTTGNNTGLIQTAVNPKLAIGSRGDTGVSLAWPVADAYLLEESLSLTGPWTPVTTSIVHAEFNNSAVIPFGGVTKKFFRLRSQPVTK